MNKNVCKALKASTESISLDLELFVFELGHELPIDSPEATRKRRCLVIEAKSNALTFAASISMQRSVQARCRQLLRRTDLEELLRDLVAKILERSFVLDGALLGGYEAFRSKVGYLRQIKVNCEPDNEVGLTEWPLDDMLLLLSSVEQDYTRIKLALEEISSLRRRLKFKYSKALAVGKIRDEEKEGMMADMLVIDSHLRFLGKLATTVLSRLSFLVHRNMDASHEETMIRRKAVSYQTAIGLLRSEISDMRLLFERSMGGIGGAIEHLAMSHKLEKIFVVQSVQMKQMVYLRLTIKEAVSLYKRISSLLTTCRDQARHVDGSVRVVRLMFSSLIDSAKNLKLKIVSVGRMMGKDERKGVLGGVLKAQKDMVVTLERWGNTIDRLDRVSSALLSNTTL